MKMLKNLRDVRVLIWYVEVERNLPRRDQTLQPTTTTVSSSSAMSSDAISTLLNKAKSSGKSTTTGIQLILMSRSQTSTPGWMHWESLNSSL